VPAGIAGLRRSSWVAMVPVMSEPDTAQLPRIGWLDRRRDLAGWLLAPLITFVAAPLAAGMVGMFELLAGGYGRTPAICESALAHNGCEESTYRLLGEHLIVFVTVWLLLWAMLGGAGYVRYVWLRSCYVTDEVISVGLRRSPMAQPCCYFYGQAAGLGCRRTDALIAE
jgi:hypothetical protein